jgi:lactoylglutathione lyase
MELSRSELHRLIDLLPEQALPLALHALNRWQAPHPQPEIGHVALWASDLERVRAFYERWFQAKVGPVYSSRIRPFRSYFLTLGAGAPLEIMASPDEAARPAHIAVCVGSRAAVDDLFARMQSDGVPVLSPPRMTGDGHYEAAVRDSEGNPVEITE